MDNAYDMEVIVKPVFEGCGFVDASVGDVLAGDCLYEIKAGRRSFRSSDLRQLLVYVALEMQKSGKLTNKVGLFNPRMGVSYVSKLETVSFEMSGKAARQLVFDLIDAMSAGSISR